ncbi:ABC transporter substrate-binding protein [Deinococcus peraridilitoris]|uniref:ABC-type sugar transport system, periplasmic component n=1 Tax=Deinococcus peraridilitoris (strain DSM 19664 / LMG 22246 / CIP 109416 / KR-200) TaxID=937777 RepID=L0A816_DEIPD|nr:sugar ABC transporter substrate-binding protein [Deinococcus peraridilitoris]AFZ69327.1 ABC-type sugar transport system, periplasmic component [Deinococcus peraridilitoris DSM 19664]
MRRFWFTVLTASLALATPALAKTTLVFSYWGDPAELPPFQEIARNFMAANPDIEIQVQHAPWSGYWTKLDAQLAAKAGPDVMFITNVPTYASRGQLEPLDAYIARDKFPIQEFNPEFLRTHQLQGKLYSIPRDNDTMVLYYNKDAFDAAKVAYPNANWRWNDLRAAAIKLTERSGSRVTRYGLVLENNKWPTFVYQNGGKVFDDPLRPTKFMLNDAKGAQAIQFIADLINKDKVAPAFQEMAQIGDSTQLFSSGQAAMVMTNAARLTTFKNAPFKWAVAPLPSGPSGQKANTVGGAGFAMNANSKNKAEAWTFLKYLAGAEGQAIFAKAGGAVPAMNRNAQVRTAFNAPFKDIFLMESDRSGVYPNFAKYVQINNTLIGPALDTVWNGESTAAAALSKIAPNVNNLLK